MKKRIIKKLVKLGLIKDPRRKEKRHGLVGSAKRWKLKQAFQISFLKNHGLKTKDIFLDIGCGTLRGGIPIIRFLDIGNYYGIDIRKNAIEEAKKELKEEKLQGKIGGLDLFKKFDELDYNLKFDKILAFSVFIHMKDEILEECLSFVSKNLAKDGVLYANVNIGDRNDLSWLEFPVMFKSIDFYKKIAATCNLEVKVVDTLHNLGHVTNDELSDQQLMLKFYKS